jgi:hypothetical protein
VKNFRVLQAAILGIKKGNEDVNDDGNTNMTAAQVPVPSGGFVSRTKEHEVRSTPDPEALS